MNEPKQQPEPKKSVILVVDNNPADSRILKTLLKNLDCSLLTAFEALDVQKIVQEGKPDLILLNMMMHLTDGCEVCRQLKDNPETKDITVIILS